MLRTPHSAIWASAFLVTCMTLTTAGTSYLIGRRCCKENQVLRSGTCVWSNYWTSFSPPFYANLSQPQETVWWNVKPLKCPYGYGREYVSLNGVHNTLEIKENLIHLKRRDIYEYAGKDLIYLKRRDIYEYEYENFCVDLNADEEKEYIATFCQILTENRSDDYYDDYEGEEEEEYGSGDSYGYYDGEEEEGNFGTPVAMKYPEIKPPFGSWGPPGIQVYPFPEEKEYRNDDSYDYYEGEEEEGNFGTAVEIKYPEIKSPLPKEKTAFLEVYPFPDDKEYRSDDSYGYYEREEEKGNFGTPVEMKYPEIKPSFGSWGPPGIQVYPFPEDKEYRRDDYYDWEEEEGNFGTLVGMEYPEIKSPLPKVKTAFLEVYPFPDDKEYQTDDSNGYYEGEEEEGYFGIPVEMNYPEIKPPLPRWGPAGIEVYPFPEDKALSRNTEVMTPMAIMKGKRKKAILVQPSK